MDSPPLDPVALGALELDEIERRHVLDLIDAGASLEEGCDLCARLRERISLSLSPSPSPAPARPLADDHHGAASGGVEQSAGLHEHDR